MNIEQILSMKPSALLQKLVDDYSYGLPNEIITIEDMNEAGKLLIRLSGDYSYLMSLLSYAKIATREAKRSGTKEEYEDAVDRKEIISNVTEAIKQKYSAISRAVTIRIENNRELHMNTEGSIYG